MLLNAARPHRSPRLPSGSVQLLLLLLPVLAVAGCAPETSNPSEQQVTAGTSSPAVLATTSAATPSSGPTVAESPAVEPTSVSPVNGQVTLDPVDVVATFAAWNQQSGHLEVSGFASVVEASGQCTVQLTGPDGATRTTSGDATPDASAMSCGVLAFPRSDLASGAWEGTLSYRSAQHEGQVQLSRIEVP